MTMSSVLLIHLQVFSLHLMAAAMPTCSLEGNMVQSAHHLLRDLVGEFPSYCYQYNANVSFPYSAFPAAKASPIQCRRVLWVVYESLREAQQIFEGHDLPVEKEGVSLDDQKFINFQHLQHRLLENGSCLSSVDGSVVLSSYFSNVTAVLQQQESAACGWKALLRDLLWVLESPLLKQENCFTWRKSQ
ncbi:interferon phi 3 [Spinachia spinachia]